LLGGYAATPRNGADDLGERISVGLASWQLTLAALRTKGEAASYPALSREVQQDGSRRVFDARGVLDEWHQARLKWAPQQRRAGPPHPPPRETRTPARAIASRTPRSGAETTLRSNALGPSGWAPYNTRNQPALNFSTARRSDFRLPFTGPRPSKHAPGQEPEFCRTSPE
jgi:hypothetical protein